MSGCGIHTSLAAGCAACKTTSQRNSGGVRASKVLERLAPEAFRAFPGNRRYARLDDHVFEAREEILRGISSNTNASVVVIAPWKSAHRVWLARRLSPVSGYAGTLGAPGGRLEKGETPRQAAVRELREETGLRIAANRLIFGRPFQYAQSEGKSVCVYTYLVHLKPGDGLPQQLEPEKSSPWALRDTRAVTRASVTPGTHDAICYFIEKGLL